MKTLTIDGWFATLTGVLAFAVWYTLLELATRLSGPAKPRARVCRVLGGTAAVGLALWCTNVIAVLSVKASQWTTIPAAQLLLPLPFALVGPAGCLTILSGGPPSIGRIGRAAGVLIAGLLMSVHCSEFALQGSGGSDESLLQTCGWLSIVWVMSAVSLMIQFPSAERHGLCVATAKYAASFIGAAVILAVYAIGLPRCQFAFGLRFGSGPASNITLLAISAVALGLAVLTVTHVILVYGGRLERRSKRFAREIEEVHSRLQYVATHDSLTGLPNWLVLKQNLSQMVGDTERPGRAIAVAVIDLDRYGSLLHSLGHGAGTWLLTEVARRIATVLRPEDILAHVGGEFVVLIDSVSARIDAQSVTADILSALRKPMSINGSEVHVRPSIGVSIWPDDGRHIDDLLSHAEAAVCAVRKVGGNDIRFFERGMADSSQERLVLENDLRRALSSGEFELWYQPEVSTRSGKVVTAEALLRWRHPVRGLIKPSSFIPLAEETGLMVPLGEWVLREACRQVAAWKAEHGLSIRVAVNLSAIQFRQQSLVEVIRAALRACNLDGSSLEVELTESSVMTNADESVGVLGQLRKMGVGVAIDDFGTGYSSLSYLRRFPIDKLKIDRSFVHDVTSSETDASIVRAIVLLAHSVGLRVVAEGVETEEQLRFISDLKCDQWQGYYFAPPLPAARFAELFANSDSMRVVASGDAFQLEPIGPHGM